VQGCVASDRYFSTNFFVVLPNPKYWEVFRKNVLQKKIEKCEYSNSHWKSTSFENFPICFWYQTISICTSCMGLEQYLSHPTKIVNYFSLP
jgi:hypothetical protein